MRIRGWAALAATALWACGDSGLAPTPSSTFVSDSTPQTDVPNGSWELLGGYAPTRMDITADTIAFYEDGGASIVARSKGAVVDGVFVAPDIGGDVYRLPVRRDGSFEGHWRLDMTSYGSVGGTVVADTFAPATTFSSPTFPWQATYLSVSEPVAGDAFSAAVKLRAGGAEVPLGLKVLTTKGMITPDITNLAEVTFPSWLPLAQKDASLDIAPLVDPSGNASPPTSTPIGFAVHPVTAVDFADGRASVADLSEDEDYVTFRSSDPVCETGSCLELGPVDAQPCFQPFMSITAWLTTTTTFSNVHVRYRILTSDAPTTTTPRALTQAFALWVPVEDGGQLAWKFDDTPVTTTATTDLGMASATDWATLTIPLNAAVRNVGFQISSGARCTDEVRATPAGGKHLLIGGITAD